LRHQFERVAREALQSSFDVCVHMHYHEVVSDSVEIQSCYCHAAKAGARAVSRMYDRHLAPADINVSQFAILANLERNPGMLVIDLAERMVMARTTLVRALQPLRAAGLLETAACGAGRSLALSLTEQGALKIREARPLWRKAQQEFEKTFGAVRAEKLRGELLAASTSL
jgi:DNA-binding MarR family transcriptional regulator